MLSLSGYRLVVSLHQELVVVLQRFRTDVDAENALDQPHVFVVSDSASIVDLRPQVVDHLVWDLLVVVQQALELPSTDCQVFVCELIWDVPANGPKLSALLDNSVEQRETKKELTEVFRLLAVG